MCGCITAAPKLKALWESYHDTYNVSTIVVPATPITSRPISDVEPYLTHNGKKVSLPWVQGLPSFVSGSSLGMTSTC